MYLPGGQRDGFAIGAIDLRVEEEVRRQPLGLRRVDALPLVSDQERSGRWLIVEIEHAKRDLGRRL